MNRKYFAQKQVLPRLPYYLTLFLCQFRYAFYLYLSQGYLSFFLKKKPTHNFLYEYTNV